MNTYLSELLQVTAKIVWKCDVCWLQKNLGGICHLRILGQPKICD